MMRPTSVRLAAQASALRVSTARQAPSAFKTQANLQARSRVQPTLRRAYATATPPPPPAGAAHPPPPPLPSGGNSNTSMWVVLAALGVIAGGGYYLLKPVAEVAQVANTTIKTVQSGADQYGDQVASLAKSILPPGAWTAYSLLAGQSGGINGFLSSLKDKDLQGVLDEVKKNGNDDVKRIVAKVEKRVKDANGKVQDVDWKALATELKGELPESSQKYIDMFIGKIPSKEDYDQFVNNLKKAGEEKKKEIEAAANKVMKEVEKAKKDGKNQADAYIRGLKAAAPGDVDELIARVKSAAKSAGLPADQIESWLVSKAQDGKFDVEQFARQMEGKLKTAAKFLPGEPKDLVAQVNGFSPSLAGLLAQSLKQADIVDDQLNRKK